MAQKATITIKLTVEVPEEFAKSSEFADRIRKTLFVDAPGITFALVEPPEITVRKINK